jgi:hypothetical protein
MAFNRDAFDDPFGPISNQVDPIDAHAQRVTQWCMQIAEPQCYFDTR